MPVAILLSIKYTYVCICMYIDTVHIHVVGYLSVNRQCKIGKESERLFATQNAL